MTLAALQRTISRPAKAADTAPRCQLCGALVPERHRHLLDEHTGNPLCVCQACTLLFHKEAAGRGHYRLIGDRRVRLAAFSTAELGVPVGLAFFVRQPDGTVTANYPSAMGATQWEVEADAWQRVSVQCPQIADLMPTVEGLLVNTARGAQEHWIVPIDDCYRLVGVIRQEWRGLSGGTTVWPAIADFFADLNAHPRRSW